MGNIWPSDQTPGRYIIEGEDVELTSSDLVEVCPQGRVWRPARIEHDGVAYVALFTDDAGGLVRLQAGMQVRRRVA